ncbi:MAG TPA: lysylphosphatidylglycerol synthase domain-containing protein [Solirubrobacteraceae bacterium]|jgi:phosphatidylinositol alpha-mannosyltransferase|nr:lysylphosphatidylglycerol synthase domain-containing protein [Solirubrobacteraceae bacterium]
MRIALVSPYSWTYPGGVLRHIEALAGELREAGHEATILAPYDPDDRRSARRHRGARPQARDLPDGVVSLGRTVGLPANGAVSNLALSPRALVRMREELRGGDYDVVHLHEPIAPIGPWDACCSLGRMPLVGTFHVYSTNLLTNGGANAVGAWRRFNRLHVRIAVSEAAAWTGRRFFGGHYRIIPNGVHLDELARPEAAPIDEQHPLRLLFVGAPVERKGLPVLLRAFEALREHMPCTLTIVGTSQEQIAPMLLDGRGITALGKVSDEEKRRQLREADVLCAPSLGGESFGMVLTEGFAAGTPVVASAIAGYGDVVRDGVDGCLVPPGNPQALAEQLFELAHDHERRGEMAHAALERAKRYAWPQVAAEVIEAYAAAIATPAPQPGLASAAVRVGLSPADRKPVVRPRRLPTLEPSPVPRARRALGLARRGAFVGLGLAVLTFGWFALKRIGVGHIVTTLLNSQPAWVLLGLALMCGAMALRGVSWQAILRAAPTPRPIRLGEALQGTFIGVLMSATLPARLGEPSRALIVARRLGRARETFPVVLGTLVSQTIINLLALAILGIIALSSSSLLGGHDSALLAVSLAPLAALLVVLALPTLISRGARTRRWARLHQLVERVHVAVLRVRAGLAVFRQPRLAAIAVAGQLGAWALQLCSCYTLLIALGLDHRADMTAAAGVLFAVNVTAVIPATPSNLGVFQAACVAVLHSGYHVGTADALAYGIILQAVEIVTAVITGGPALVREGLSWRDVRLRAMHAAPIELRLPSDAKASDASGV